MFNMALRLLSKVHKGGEGAVTRSLQLLEDMERWHERSGGAIARPDETTFSLVLKTISDSGAQSSASHAQAVVRKMEGYGLQPREGHYIGLIRSFLRTGRADPKKAETILQYVKDKYRRDKSAKPTTSMYSVCIAAYAGSREHNSTSKVMELFEELNELYKETNDPAFRPDSMLYGAVIDAVTKAKSTGDKSLHMAIQFLGKMEKSFDLGEIEEGPNRYAYTNILRALSRSRAENAATLAEELMERMDRRSRELKDESIRPDTHAYTALIHALANSREPDSVQRAQKWFVQMSKRYHEGDSGSKPNKVTCTALINCWKKSGREDAGREAESVLSMMETSYEQGDLDLKPDAFVYAAAIDAWARSASNEKAERAWDIYQRMKTQYSNGNMDSKPNNVIVSTPVMKVW